MTHGAVACVAWASLRTQRRVADVGVTLITGMNAMNHQVVTDTRSQLLRVVRSRNQRRIVAKNAHFHLVAVIAVEVEEKMTLITGSGLSNDSTRLYRRSVYREIDHLVDSSGPHIHLGHGSG